MKTTYIILFIFLMLVLFFSFYEMLYTLDSHGSLLLLILFGGLVTADIVAISSIYFRYLKNPTDNK